jgi:hypothetical protein
VPAIPPFHPPCGTALLISPAESAGRVALAKFPFMSTMCRQRRRPMPAEALAVDKEILRAWRTPQVSSFARISYVVG